MYRWYKCYKEWSWNLHEVIKAILVSCDTKLFPILVIGISGLFNILGWYGRFQWQVMSIKAIICRQILVVSSYLLLTLSRFTLLGSGSESPKDKALLLTGFIFWKINENQKRKEFRKPFWKLSHLSTFNHLSLKSSISTQNVK